LSARSNDGNEMLFMPRKSPALVESDELFFVDFEKPVPQSSLHQAIYKARPDVKAVFHFHSPAVILLSVLGQTLRPMHNYSAIFYDGVPLYTGTGQVESPGRAGEMVKLLDTAKALMLRGHGAAWSDSRFAKSACWRFSRRSRRVFKPKPCDSAPQCLWSATRPKESPNGHSNLLPSNVHGSILQRNAPADLFCAVRRWIYAKPRWIALCDGHSSASAGIIARRAELTFPNPALSGLGGSNRRDCACQRWFDGKRFDHCLLSVRKSEIPEVGSVFREGKNLKLEVERLGKSQAEIQQETDRSQED